MFAEVKQGYQVAAHVDVLGQEVLEDERLFLENGDELLVGDERLVEELLVDLVERVFLSHDDLELGERVVERHLVVDSGAVEIEEVLLGDEVLFEDVDHLEDFADRQTAVFVDIDESEDEQDLLFVAHARTDGHGQQEVIDVNRVALLVVKALEQKVENRDCHVSWPFQFDGVEGVQHDLAELVFLDEAIIFLPFRLSEVAPD